MNTFNEQHEISSVSRVTRRRMSTNVSSCSRSPSASSRFFNTHRQQCPVSKALLTDVCTQYQRRVSCFVEPQGSARSLK